MDRLISLTANERQYLQQLGLASKEKKSKNEENLSKEHYPPPLIGALNNSELNNNSLQFHLKAENGQISYRVVDFGNQNKRSGLLSSELASLQALASIDQSTLAMSNRSSSQLHSKRKQPPISASIQLPTQLNENSTKNNAEKRSKHNEIERKRRDKINNWIIKLSKMVPDCQNDTSKQSQSKGVILTKACDYISNLEKRNNKLTNVQDENVKLRKELNEIRKEKNELTRENERLKNLLKENGIAIKELTTTTTATITRSSKK